MRHPALLPTLLLAALAHTAVAADADPHPSISAEGSVTRRVAPTQAIWEVHINGGSDDIEDTLKDAQGTRDAVAEAMKKAGIPAADIQIGHCALSTGYNTGGSSFSSKAAAPSPCVAYTIVAAQQDLGAVEKTLTALCKVKGASVSLRYSNPELEKIRREVRVEAAKLAKAQAKEMAEALGETLGATRKVSEVRPQAGSNAGTLTLTGVVVYTDGRNVGTAAPELPDSIPVTVSVEAEFELVHEGKK